ncbi:MAG: menaquinone biosynthesis family protein [Planctomycetota bacterium]|jgi:1,4-dihydroxy-6-naphthoate synthase
MPAEPITLTIAHSPDPDDAFMWRPLGSVGGDVEPFEPSIDTSPFRFQPVMLDIESLNKRAIERGDLDATAISFHTYPHVKDTYALTSCGASMGEGYGPKIVAREVRDIDWLSSEIAIATPGIHTTAHLTLRLLLGKAIQAVEVPFEEIIDHVAGGNSDAGIVIHEGQLTYPDHGLRLVIDLGAWWTEQTGLPLPLGANVIRRDLDDRYGPDTSTRLTRVLLDSIRASQQDRSASLAYAASFGRGISEQRNDEFVSLYVNPLSEDMGERGARAVRELLTRAHEQGLCPDPGDIDIVRPA